MQPKRRGAGTYFAIVLVLLPVLWGVMQHIGPRSPLPAVDPTLAQNQRAAALAKNAADAYVEAVRRLGDTWNERFDADAFELDKSLSAEEAAWLADHQDVLEALHGATAKDCLFKLTSVAGAFPDPDPSYSQQRVLSRILGLQARAAVTAQDMDGYEQAGDAIFRMSGHLDQQRTVIGMLLASAYRQLWSDLALRPFEWETTPEGERAAYADHLLGLDVTPIDTKAALTGERDFNVWYISALMGGAKTLIVPVERVAGELDRLSAPFLTFAALPLEVQCRQLRGGGIPGFTAGRVGGFGQFFNIPRTVAAVFVVDPTRAIELTLRSLTTQRGVLATAAVWKYRLTRGTFPASLADAGADGYIDPFSAAPFVYRTTGDDGFILYSVGIDGDDDGGRHDDKFGESKSGGAADGDYVIWSIQRDEEAEPPSGDDAGEADAAEDESGTGAETPEPGDEPSAAAP